MLEIKKLSDSQCEISIEISASDFEKHYKEAFEEISKNISIDGFRPGKAPQEILEKNIDNNVVLKKAAEKAIRENYFSVLREKKIEAIGRPEIIITKIAKGDSFCFKATTAILPEITLPDYKKIARDVRGKKEEAPTFAESEVGVPTSDAGGRNVGREKTRQKKRMAILEAISDAAEIKIPETLVKAEKEKMVGELMSSIENMGMKWHDYLSQIKKTEEDLKKEWQADAFCRVKYGLILRELAEKENIQVDAGELESEMEEVLKNSPGFARGATAEGLDRGYLGSYIYGIIRNEKVFNFLETC